MDFFKIHIRPIVGQTVGRIVVQIDRPIGDLGSPRIGRVVSRIGRDQRVDRTVVELVVGMIGIVVDRMVTRHIETMD